MLPKVAIVILNWNGWQDSTELMSSLKNASYEPTLIIVIDNASTDHSISHIERWLADNQVSCSIVAGDSTEPKKWVAEQHFLFIKSDTNLGFCAGNNLGMEWAVKLGADYVLILNNDTLVAPDFLQPMIEVAEGDERVGLVGGIITHCEQPNTIWWAGGSFNRFLVARRLLDGQPLDELKQKKPFETEWISGCMMMIPARIFSRFGGYPEEYFIWSEEWDYSLMVSRAGHKLMVAPNAKICHKIGRSLGIMKPLNYYYGIRNGLFFKRKYLLWYLWYPYLAQYLLNRVVRFAQLNFQGRSDLAKAGTAAIKDFLAGRSGKWGRQG